MKTLDEIIYTEFWDRMVEFQGDITKAARSLKIGRATAYRYLKKYRMLDDLRHRFPAKKGRVKK